MQQALYNFLFLGHVPGTNINLGFWQIVALASAGLALLWLHFRRPGFRYEFRLRQRTILQKFSQLLETTRAGQLIGRRD